MVFPKYAAMLQQTEANYKVAISYYEQKEAAFQKAVAKDSEDTWRIFQEELNKTAQTFGDYILPRARQIIESGTYTAEQKKEDGAFSVYIQELFRARKRGAQGKDWVNMAAAGFTFEKFMSDNAISASQAAKLANFLPGVINNLIAQHIGKVSQFAATTGRVTDIRSDLAYGSSTITNNNKMELVNFLDIEGAPPGVSTGDFLLNAIQEEKIDQNVYGFQLKTYQKGANDKRWQNSAILMNEITALFNAATRRTWSSNYAVNFPVYYLSKFLINIINPVNVGTLTPDGIEYSSDMLRAYRFYMEVAWDELSTYTPASAARGGGIEVQNPHIATKDILLRQVQGSIWKGLAANGRLRQSATYEKAVKVASIRNIT